MEKKTKKIIFYIALISYFYLVSKFNIGYNDIRFYLLLIGVVVALIIFLDAKKEKSRNEDKQIRVLEKRIRENENYELEKGNENYELKVVEKPKLR